MFLLKITPLDCQPANNKEYLKDGQEIKSWHNVQYVSSHTRVVGGNEILTQEIARVKSEIGPVPVGLEQVFVVEVMAYKNNNGGASLSVKIVDKYDDKG